LPPKKYAAMAPLGDDEFMVLGGKTQEPQDNNLNVSDMTAQAV